uniref:Armadillo like helical domain containing 1 n=1 Tax=Monopterus albus TaxID=43700 RepID=A0A3Q3R3Y1_MONAL
MSAQEEQANIGKVLSFLRQWDRGGRRVRSCMLNTFLTKNTGKTCYELELEFAQVASLFLARLTTWMRLTYMFGTCLGLQLKALGIFLSISSHDQYLMEFLEDGGVLTLLDILSHAQSKEEDKAEALHLLLTVSNAGCKYREIICESCGVKVIAECLAKSNAEETQEVAWTLMESLSHGNPKYLNQIYKCLITLMTHTSPKTQQLVLHALRTVYSRLFVTLTFLLMCKVLSEAEMIKMTGSLPVFEQQAAAAKAIRMLAEEDHELSQELLSLGVIQNLLYAMGNREHIEAQIQASLALAVHICTHIQKHTRQIFHKPETLYMNMDEIQAEILLSNKVNITEGNDSFQFILRILSSLFYLRITVFLVNLFSFGW